MDSSVATPSAKHPDNRSSPNSSGPPLGSSSAHTGTKRVNSRRKSRSILPRITSNLVSAPEFIQPSKLFGSAKQPTASPFRVRTSDLTRQVQVQQSTPKTEITKAANRRDNKPKPYTLEPPPQAQKYPSSDCLEDFFPWHPNRPEEALTDIQARNGQYDKLSVGKSNNEQASARSIIAPTLKQRPGLATLSVLFLSVLERRQNSGQIPAVSTFKPPPRIALPDPRKEAWLRDLASLHVPLRRLSRTIPHGLKGPVLLEQCLAKEVPVPRAVWLIRCVGANELRGLRRKGVGSLAVGGEARWIGEWTVQVAQFLEKVLFGSSVPIGGPWHHHIVYTIRLVLHLYAEGLLEGSVFLDWLLSLAQSCSSERLPLVFAVIAPLWDDLMKQRRLAYRLGQILHQNMIQNVQQQEHIMPPCRRYMAKAIELYTTHRRGVVSPLIVTDTTFYHTMVDCRDFRLSIPAKSVLCRTTSISKGKVRACTDGQLSDCRKLLTYLDQTKLPYDCNKLYQEFSAVLTLPYGVFCLCQWAVTPLRSGLYRVYLAVRLLMLVSGSGIDLQEALIRFLEHCEVRNSTLYLLMAEITRHRLFSVAGYMRWLISSGELPKVHELNQAISPHALVLSQLPTRTASPRLKNLRRILLRNCGSDTDSEAKLIADTKEMLVRHGIFPGSYSSTLTLAYEDIEHLKTLGRTAQSELGTWIRDKIRQSVTQKENQAWSGLQLNRSSYIEPQQFVLVRQVLESFSDIAMLADIVRAILLLDGCELLKMAIETLISNADAFFAMAFLPDAVDLVYERYTVLRSRHCLEKSLIITFSDLMAILPNDKIVQEISHDLATYDRDYPRSAAAPSPISEPMGDIFDDDGMDNNEEIERLWVSNVAAEKQNLSRLFEIAVSNLEASLDNNDSVTPVISATQGLCKLHDMDTVFFEEAMHGWVMRTRSSSNCIPFFRALALLIIGNSVSIASIAQAALLPSHDQIISESEYHFVWNTLRLVLYDDPFDIRLSPQQSYTLKTNRHLFLRNHKRMTLELFRRFIQLSASVHSDDLTKHTAKLLSCPSSLEVLRGIAAREPGVFMSEFVEPLSRSSARSTGAIKWLLLLVDHILEDYDPTEDAVHPEQVGRLLTIVDDFNIDICKLKLQLLFTVCAPEASSISTEACHDRVSQQKMAKAVVRGFVSTSDSRHHLCTDLIALLSPEHTHEIFSTAEDLVLESHSFLQARQILEKLDLPGAEGSEASEHLARSLLTVIESTFSRGRSGDHPDLPSVLVERLSTLLQKLSDLQLATSDTSWETPGVSGELRSWLLLLLRLVVLHCSELSATRSSTAAYDQARIVFCLYCLLQDAYVQNCEDIAEYTADIAAQLSDDLPNDLRAQLRRCAFSHRPPPGMSHQVGIWDSTDNLEAFQRGKVTDYFPKSWERLSEPAPAIGENDTSLSLALFRARRT